LDELDMVLRLGGAVALGISVQEHGERVARLLEIPQVRAPRVRRTPGAGSLEALHREQGEEPLLLGSDYGPSVRCPACNQFSPLRDEGARRETRSGVYSRHSLQCRWCLARGEVQRYYSFRLRGNRDQIQLRFPGLLGPLATRRWSKIVGIWLMLLSFGLLFSETPWEPTLLVGFVYLLRAEAPGPTWEFVACLLGLVAAGLGMVGNPHGLWILALLLSLLGLGHATWALLVRPPGWDLPEKS
jgi:hypothetical protein